MSRHEIKFTLLNCFVFYEDFLDTKIDFGTKKKSIVISLIMGLV